MRPHQIKIPAIVLLAASIVWCPWVQNQSEHVYAAAAPAPGQQPTTPAAPTPTPTPAPVPAPGAARPPTPGAQTQKPEEQTRIVADPATNSLVIYGTAQEYQNIRNILKDLDIVPRQVLLDVMIAEVTLTNSETFGIEYEIFSKNNPSIFGQQFGSQGAVRSGILPPPGSPFTQFGPGISGIIGRSNAIQAFINALAKDSRIKVLSSPSILAADNRPARIQVGSQEPVATGSVSTPITTTGTGAATSFATSSTIQYQNTGRIVTIIPQVNSQGLVNLQILAEVSQINPEASVTLGTAGSFPSFDIRQAETTAVVQDGDGLVIGGIIADNRSKARTGIPYLMDIPVIGRLFGTTTDNVTRTELIMLITPHVIRNRDQGQQITEDFKKSLSSVRNELERMAREREKLQQIPLQQKPTLPGPAGDIPPIPPAPAPSSSVAPGSPGASVLPLRKIDVAATSPAEDNAAVIAPVMEVKRANPAASGAPAAQKAAPPVSPQMMYALAVTNRPEKAPAPARGKPVPENTRPAAHKWAVQVAALARKQDAEMMVAGLRKDGYDAYVITYEAENKTWHRVRVGRFADLHAANQLKSTLASSTEFKHAYVAAS